MRKLAPAFILTSIVALASTSALAFGDMNKSKKAPATETTSQTTTPSSSPGYTAAPANVPAAPTQHNETPKPSGSTAAGVSGATTSSMNGSTSATGAPMASGAVTTTTSTDAAVTDKDKAKLKKKQIAANDPKCDASKYASRDLLPKDCGGAAPAQSGGDSSPAGAGAAGSAAAGSSSSSAGSGGASK